MRLLSPRITTGAIALTAGVSLLFLSGCGAMARDDQADRARMAAAVHAEYPDVEAEDTTNIVVLEDRNTIRLVNQTSDSIRNATVWLDGTFAQRLDLLPPNGQIELRKDNFYDRRGDRFTQFSESPRRVQVEHDDNLYNLRITRMN